MCNNVITPSPASENAKQNIDQMLLDAGLPTTSSAWARRALPGIRGAGGRPHRPRAERPSLQLLQATWRMVTLCKRKHERCRRYTDRRISHRSIRQTAGDKSRKIMRSWRARSPCERHFDTLYHFKIEQNQLVDGKYRVKGRHEAVNPISESLRKRFIDNGMPQEVLTQLVGKKPAPSKNKSGSSPAKAGQTKSAPKARTTASKPPAKPKTSQEGGESA